MTQPTQPHSNPDRPDHLVGYAEGPGEQPCVKFRGTGTDLVGHFTFEGSVFRTRLIEAWKRYVTPDLTWAYNGTWSGLGMLGHWSRRGDYNGWSGTWLLCKEPGD